MPLHSREIKSFFFSQYFSDGLRISMGLLLPAVVFAQFGMLATGVTLSLGAACMSVIDNPGPAIHKRNAMLIGNLVVFFITLITGFARYNLWVLGAEITFFFFLFSILIIYGNRAGNVGSAGVLAIIFTMDKALPVNAILPFCLTVSAGGIWYMAMSLLFFGIRPYRAAQQALGENIRDVVNYLRTKSDFYLSQTDLDANYRKLISQQILVSQHQDAVRELLFKSRLVVRESTNYSRMLLLTFVDLVDLFEQIMATHYDYSHMHEQYGHTGILEDIGHLLHRMGDELDNVGYAVLSNTSYDSIKRFDADLEQLKTKIDAIGATTPPTANMVLKKVLINLRDLSQKIVNIANYHTIRSSKKLIDNPNEVDYARFVSHQDFSPQVLINNLSFKSSAFRFALRVSLVSLLGLIITKSSALLYLIHSVTGKQVAFGQHSYWVLLTIIVILKPAYSLSKQRNFQRLVGTIVGGLIGVAILTLVHNGTAQVIILAILMIGAYSFIRINYIVSIMFMTPYVLILFKFLGVGHLNVAEERILDTIIGSVIAFAASYLVFPTWESEQLKIAMRDVITANVNYLIKIAENITGIAVSATNYKLARKDVYIKSAELAGAFERMNSEPKARQIKNKDVHKFVVLNHILSSYIATIASGLSGKELHKTRPENLKMVKRSINVLNDTARKLGGTAIEFIGDKPIVAAQEQSELSGDETLLKDQLGFINKISTDVAKVSDDYLK
ncbi:hypothetical protein HH214_20595 [Mucilaginibacter robiniae]|uniref:Integral membrane protein YccS N-terminal domain-containing protein n=1 Tax=Mucilaginibacter robiniae TaxID=2728022 RepID=A0A7L5EAY3_9SPHI|nr:FUSC family membrane protein [Mucilaginibacter robiniae]QJD98103.1 hypothetical protein HH214_20595 [Mucilaginibacter robiniae]